MPAFAGMTEFRTFYEFVNCIYLEIPLQIDFIEIKRLLPQMDPKIEIRIFQV
jgi:hypothetical protein